MSTVWFTKFYSCLQSYNSVHLVQLDENSNEGSNINWEQSSQLNNSQTRTVSRPQKPRKLLSTIPEGMGAVIFQGSTTLLHSSQL